MTDHVSRSGESRMVHLPAVVADEFKIARSEARRRIALGRVKVNGEVTTDLDIPLPDTEMVSIELECHPLADSLAQMLRAQQNAVEDRDRRGTSACVESRPSGAETAQSTGTGADAVSATATPNRACECCKGTGHTDNRIVYNRMPGGWEPCARCGQSGVEPVEPAVHAGLVVRNARSGKVWVVYGSYPPDEWGLHRMKPAKHGGHYVWQIILRYEADLLDARRWRSIGFGDAWDHALMESDPLPVAPSRGRDELPT